MTCPKISQGVYDLLICPICQSKVTFLNDTLVCENSACKTSFPIVNGIPILINEKSSIFAMEDFTTQRNTTFKLQQSALKKRLRQLMPTVSNNIKAKQNYAKFADLILSITPAPKVLVVGGSILGKGMESLTQNKAIELVETDVSFGPCTKLICDAHDIPFADESFDAVIAQAVLEHVTDPYRCADEFHRVLKKEGLVYAETPFIQQVHMGRYDFTRFTHLGHRRLFRKFTEIESGSVCGPGMALALSYQYFLQSFVNSRSLRALVKLFSNLTAFYLKYFDYFLINRAGAYDAGSGYYFMGKKSNEMLADRDLIKLYKGAL